MHRIYLTRQPSEHFTLPTTAFPSSEDPSIAEALVQEQESESPYGLLALSSLPSDIGARDSKHTPGVLGEAEVLYGSASRTGRVAREPSLEQL